MVFGFVRAVSAIHTESRMELTCHLKSPDVSAVSLALTIENQYYACQHHCMDSTFLFSILVLNEWTFIFALFRIETGSYGGTYTIQKLVVFFI